MNDKKSFLFRHTDGPVLKNGKKTFEEDFYINQKLPHAAGQNLLHCFGYGECLWYGGYKQSNNFSKKYYSFGLVTEGDGIFSCENMKYKIIPGDIFILRPSRDFCVQTGQCGFLRKKSLLLQGSLLNIILDSRPLGSLDFIRPNGPHRLKEIFDSFKTLILEENESLPEDLGMQAYALMAELSRLAPHLEYPESLCRAISVIDAELNREHTLESLSTECSTSISTLSRLFRTHLNTSPMNYIIDRRLELAAQLLQIDKMPLKEIAEKCGYNSESFLSRAFKKKFGLPPATFRNTQK